MSDDEHESQPSSLAGGPLSSPSSGTISPPEAPSTVAGAHAADPAKHGTAPSAPTPEAQVAEADAFAAEIHAGQWRKGRRTLYVEHPRTVAEHVARHGGDAEERIAALLHDTVEDGGGVSVLLEIERRFGSRVAGLVEELSDSLVDTRTGGEKAPWLERKTAYLARVAYQSESGALIKAADQLSNLEDCIVDYRDVGELLWQRFNTGPTDGPRQRRGRTIWYHRAVLEGLRALDFPRPRPILEAVAARLDELERLSTTVG